MYKIIDVLVLKRNLHGKDQYTKRVKSGKYTHLGHPLRSVKNPLHAAREWMVHPMWLADHPKYHDRKTIVCNATSTGRPDNLIVVNAKRLEVKKEKAEMKLAQGGAQKEPKGKH